VEALPGHEKTTLATCRIERGKGHNPLGIVGKRKNRKVISEIVIKKFCCSKHHIPRIQAGADLSGERGQKSKPRYFTVQKIGFVLLPPLQKKPCINIFAVSIINATACFSDHLSTSRLLSSI
jgi:hypothetical protein